MFVLVARTRWEGWLLKSCERCLFFAFAAASIGLAASSTFAAEQKFERQIEAYRFVAECGAADDGPAIQDAVNRFSVVFLSDGGCARALVINTTINIPAGHSIKAFGSGWARSLVVKTTADVSTFSAAGDNVSIEGLYIAHTGSAGYAIDCGVYNYCTLRDIEAWGVNGTDASAVVHTRGAQSVMDHLRVVNCRPNAFAVDIDGSSRPSVYAATVNDILTKSVIFASSQPAVCNGASNLGRGIHIWSSDNSARPEGINISDTVVQMEANTNLRVEQVNNLNLLGDTFDSSAGVSIELYPVNTGIAGLEIVGGYIATPLNTQSGVCVKYNTGSAAPMREVKIHGVDFGICGYGVVFAPATQSNASDLSIEGNTFGSIGAAAIDVQNWRTAHIRGNTVQSAVQNMTLADGSSGGPYDVDGNAWDSTASMSITETTPFNFHFGDGNTGTVLSGYAAATTGIISASGCVSLAIPIRAPIPPNPDKITLGARIVSGAFTNVGSIVTSVTRANINVSVCASETASGAIRVAAHYSL
jgi:hypothetical protein